MDVSRLGLRDPRSSDGVTGGPVVHERARVHERDEDGVGQVKEKDDGEFE